MAVSLIRRAIAAYESGAWARGGSGLRWRRIFSQLTPVLPVLEPWVQTFGY